MGKLHNLQDGDLHCRYCALTNDPRLKCKADIEGLKKRIDEAILSERKRYTKEKIEKLKLNVALGGSFLEWSNAILAEIDGEGNGGGG